MNHDYLFIFSTGSGVGSAVRGVNLLDVSAVTQNTTTLPIPTGGGNGGGGGGSTMNYSSGSSKEQGQGQRKKRRTLASKVFRHTLSTPRFISTYRQTMIS